MVQVDGILIVMDNTEDLLNAALVIVDTKSSEQVNGEILGVNADSLTLDPDTETVCGVAVVEPIVIGYPSDTKYFTVTITDTDTTITPGEAKDLDVGQDVGLNISCDSYNAETIVIIDEQSP